ncbi:MAG: helix-hairpin-helix domain-containing protein, partial [Deltaproteobacteria bacterium]|nr:helix-hairpin-helix domain-containing protein [Deltaproteobacteria bacterium]
MKNQNLAKMFYEIAEYLEMDGVPFKPYAYQKAATTLEAMKEDVEDLYQKGGVKALKALPGVGEAIAKKIEEYLTTGKLRYYEEFKEKMPIDLDEIIRVEGMGPRRAKILFEKLGVKNLKELEEVARGGKIALLSGFGEKTEKNILEAIEFLKRSKGRFLLGDLLPVAEEVLEKLRKVKGVERADMAGSLRRMKETVGDVDFLVISREPERVMDVFVSMPGVEKIWGKGKTKSSVRMEAGFDMDVRVIAPESYGAALQYFTGSKEHNITLRTIAIDRGFKLSEYGLFKGSKNIAAKTEEEIYRRLGLQWIPPEMREDRGEIGLAEEGKLLDLVSQEDIRGDLHVHSDWDGGSNSIEKIAETAREMGYQYVGISDHTKFLKIERGLDEKKILERNREIDRLNEKRQKA